MKVFMDLCWRHGVLSFQRKLGKEDELYHWRQGIMIRCTFDMVTCTRCHQTTRGSYPQLPKVGFVLGKIIRFELIETFHNLLELDILLQISVSTRLNQTKPNQNSQCRDTKPEPTMAQEHHLLLSSIRSSSSRPGSEHVSASNLSQQHIEHQDGGRAASGPFAHDICQEYIY